MACDAVASERAEPRWFPRCLCSDPQRSSTPVSKGVSRKDRKMTDDVVPSPLDMASMEGVCPHTVQGWLWNCGVPDTHGNADSEHEAWFVAQAHEEHRATPD